MKKFVVLFLFGMLALPVMAREIYLQPDMSKFFTQTNPRSANAICFMYANNHFKCACRFSDNSKIWVSKPLAEFEGELGTMNDKYGYIEACEGASRRFQTNK